MRSLSKFASALRWFWDPRAEEARQAPARDVPPSDAEVIIALRADIAELQQRLAASEAACAEAQGKLAGVLHSYQHMRSTFADIYNTMVDLGEAQATRSFGQRNAILERWAQMWTNGEICRNNVTVH